MLCNSSYQQIINEIAEIGIWASPFINIGDAENLTCREFDFYKEVYKEKFEKEQENKQEIIKKAFEFGADCTKAICKTIAGVFGKRK
jgi:hypothetical protein